MPTPIKPEDLRVGNLIQSKYGKTILVESIISNYGINAQAGDGNCMYCDHEESEIFGIPLTEEWLLKLGFKHDTYGNWMLWIDNDLNIFVHFKDRNCKVFNIVSVSDSDIPNCRYVHQLQNLYYCLSGQELTFKE